MRLRDALRDYDYRARFCDAEKITPTAAVLCPNDWEMLFTRHRLLALLRPGTTLFIRARPADEPFCPQQLSAVMI